MRNGPHIDPPSTPNKIPWLSIRSLKRVGQCVLPFHRVCDPPPPSSPPNSNSELHNIRLNARKAQKKPTYSRAEPVPASAGGTVLAMPAGTRKARASASVAMALKGVTSTPAMTASALRRTSQYLSTMPMARADSRSRVCCALEAEPRPKSILDQSYERSSPTHFPGNTNVDSTECARPTS